MKQFTTLFLILLLLLSCTSRTIYKKPKDLIEKDKMITIWVDLYIARGARIVKTKTLKKDINYVPSVLKKYQIDSVQFSKSNIYYISRIDEYEEMFEEVMARLEVLKKEYKRKTLKDSTLPVLDEILDSMKNIELNRKQSLLENTMD